MRKLKFLHKNLSKKKKGSNNRDKARRKLNKKYERITNKKQDFLHKLSNRIVNENQVICLEDLNIKGMVKNHKLADSISEVSWYEFVRQLKYKAEWKGRTIVQVDRFFPSSKTCYDCGFINQDLTLKEREWVCPKCGTHHDRDINASHNILRQGLNKISLEKSDFVLDKNNEKMYNDSCYEKENFRTAVGTTVESLWSCLGS